ncbi:MAG: hypothetical protein U1D97_08360, partial [Desulfuromonadales bacterium]|nr:hypothetical protein [Desulfuromonadales bacterium]
MGFVKSKLFDLTERSTPYQMRSLEFQRAIQSTTADLVKVGSSRTQEDFTAFQAGVSTSLAEVKQTQEAIETLTGGEKAKTYDELKTIGNGIVDVTQERIKAEMAAKTANETITKNLQAASKKLGELDSQIQDLQQNATASFVSSMTEVGNISTELGGLETAKSHFKDLQLAFLGLRFAQDKRSVNIAKDAVNAVSAKIAQDPYLKTNIRASREVVVLRERQEELSRLLEGVETDDKKVDALSREVAERISSLVAVLEQEVAKTREMATTESKYQGDLMAQSNVTTTILISTSQLLGYGLTIEGLATKLFTVLSQKDLDATDARIKKTFEKAEGSIGACRKGLEELKDGASLKILQEVDAALKGIRSILFAPDGVIAKIRGQLTMQEKAGLAMEELRKVVLREADKSKKTVSTARGEQ